MSIAEKPTAAAPEASADTSNKTVNNSLGISVFGQSPSTEAHAAVTKESVAALAS